MPLLITLYYFGWSYPLLEIRSGLRQIPGPAKIAPVIFVGWKSNDSFSLPGETHIGINDGKNALLR